jgi:hypothetical protein
VHREYRARVGSRFEAVACTRVTKGRYTDARVDPSELSVQVLGPDGQWRKAQSLSHGTAEQIYLLLRMTLADRLTRRGEVSPIILDDVLVQCDKQRKIALLDVLLTMSRTRQVILLTQEDEVLQWARENHHCAERTDYAAGAQPEPVRKVGDKQVDRRVYRSRRGRISAEVPRSERDTRSENSVTSGLISITAFAIGMSPAAG